MMRIHSTMVSGDILLEAKRWIYDLVILLWQGRSSVEHVNVTYTHSRWDMRHETWRSSPTQWTRVLRSSPQKFSTPPKEREGERGGGARDIIAVCWCKSQDLVITKILQDGLLSHCHTRTIAIMDAQYNHILLNIWGNVLGLHSSVTQHETWVSSNLRL